MPSQFVSSWEHPVLSSIRRLSLPASILHNACSVVQRGEILITAEKFTDLFKPRKTRHRNLTMHGNGTRRNRVRQLAQVFESKHARTGHSWKIKVSWAGASAGSLGRSYVSV